MAFSQDFDPTKGYVALPCDVMDIEMSPGGFRLLVELCRMANRAGECWPSLGQLSERIGRSKAAISGYISELRALEIVETANQKMANGYNYRLKYRVTFWQAWRAKLSAPRPANAPSKTERSVQPIERRVNSKNQNQINHTPEPNIQSETDHPKLVSVFSKWSNLSKAAPFPCFNAPIPESLLRDTQEILARSQRPTLSKTLLQNALSELWSSLKVDAGESHVDEQVRRSLAQNLTATGFRYLASEVTAQWQGHWRKPPNAAQFKEMLKAAQKANRSEGMTRMLEQFLQRWKISQNKLQPNATSPNLALKHAA